MTFTASNQLNPSDVVLQDKSDNQLVEGESSLSEQQISQSQTSESQSSEQSTPEQQIADLVERVMKLEMLISEQEFTIETLNEAVVDLQKRLIDNEYKLKLLGEYVKTNLASSGIAKESEETPPPHY